MVSFSTYNLPIPGIYEEEKYQVRNPVPGDYDYDPGYADDGWPNPMPCIICGVEFGACVGPDHDYTMLDNQE